MTGVLIKRTLIQDHFGFLFVRHPFSRLVSAYRDKVLFNTYRNWSEMVTKDFQKAGVNIHRIILMIYYIY